VNYHPIVYKLEEKATKTITDATFDVVLSNNIAYPMLTMGFQHYIHKSKDKMEIIEQFNNRKKVYLVTSLFEKVIDKKDETESGIPHTSIDHGLKDFIKDINPKFPEILSRAFLKLWEMIVYFDLIPATEHFVSAHLAEGPGSFIQATILYRDAQAKSKKIKSSKNDKFYAVTLHSDNEHLLMEKEFINYYAKESPKRLHILNTVNKRDMMMQGGGFNFNSESTNGDITKLNTINMFGGANDKNGFSQPADLITADGGFDWKKENLQEQEAYRLIFGQIVTALKTQKASGNFVIKIFETYTTNTIKLIELLRTFYADVFICKPFTSRISNSEKYIICKEFNKKSFTPQIAKKLEDMVSVMNKNEQYNIINLFSDYKFDKNILDLYKNINIELSLKQFVGINNIIKFINLDNYNGIEYNDYLDKQIIASTFWINTFLDPSKYKSIQQYINHYKHKFDKPQPMSLAIKEDNDKKQIEKEFATKQSRVTRVVKKVPKTVSKTVPKTVSKTVPKTDAKKTKVSKSKSKKKVQTGGGDGDDIEEPNHDIIEQTEDSDNDSEDSNNEYITKLNEELPESKDIDNNTENNLASEHESEYELESEEQ